MSLDSKEIDREQRVILSEILARDSAESHTGKAAISYMLPDSLIAKRDVLGTAADIQSLTRQRFVDFYETWYTPARVVVVAAGDFDKNLSERMIAKNFADVVARRGEQPTPAMGKIDRDQNVTAKFFKNADLQTAVVRLEMVTPATCPTPSAASGNFCRKSLPTRSSTSGSAKSSRTKPPRSAQRQPRRSSS